MQAKQPSQYVLHDPFSASAKYSFNRFIVDSNMCRSIYEWLTFKLFGGGSFVSNYCSKVQLKNENSENLHTRPSNSDGNLV